MKLKPQQFSSLLKILTWSYVLACLATTSIAVAAEFCATSWDGAQISATLAGRPATLSVPLRDKQQKVHEVTVDQIQAYTEANERITRAAGLSPRLIICNDTDPNAFATKGQKGEVVGVTVGMLRMTDGDRDMAAAVLGHELAHHTKRHRENAAARDAFIGIAAILLGAAVDARTQRRTGVATGLGVNLGLLGGKLFSRKFDRDQEREADEVGFDYLVSAGFNPTGAVRMSEKLNQLGGGAGLFFDSHPGWPERTERFRTMIAGNAQAQLLAKNTRPTTEGSASASQDSISPELIGGTTVAITDTYPNEPAQTARTSGGVPSSALQAASEPSRLATLVNRPQGSPPQVQAQKQGKFVISAEKVAAAESCPVNKPATLTDSGPGYEEFMVACPSGELLAVRCDFGTCKVVK